MVASYCRVSTDHNDQINSFDAQKRYYKAYIQGHPDWELYDIYADEGITGTTTKKRTQFNRMIADAYDGKFQIILTKEVSRFSRNILDTISYTRELKTMGVAVVFVTDGINTMDPDAELRLSIMASIAQEESRKTSTRVKWGQTRQMERGVVFGHSMLGYEVKNGTLQIEPEGAELVRLIFQKYGIEKKGTTVIARELQQEGYRTCSGNTKWSNSHILKILKNEKYVGDLVQKKSYTPDFLTHEKKINRGEEKLIILKDHHKPIIERELWDLVQSEIMRRNRHCQKTAGHSSRYAFSGKIRCGECESAFVARRKTTNKGVVIRWSCRKAACEGGKRTDTQGNKVGCDVGRLLRNDAAAELVGQALHFLRIDTGALVENLTKLSVDGICPDGNEAKVSQEWLENEISRVEKKRTMMLDAYFSGEINFVDMQTLKHRYEKQIGQLEQKMKAAGDLFELQTARDKLQHDLREKITMILAKETVNETICREVLDRITVFKDRHIELRFKHLPHVFHFTDNIYK